MKISTRKLTLRAAVFAVGMLSANPRARAATDVWNNSTTLWESPTAWTPMGPPTATDIASFDPTVAATTVMNPTINLPTDVAMGLNLNNNFLGGTYSFGGTGTLTLGAGGIVVRGFGTQTISGPILAGAATGNLSFNIGTDSGLTLGGATTALTNAGAVNLNGGTLTLDNSTSATAKLGTTSVPSFVGGTVSVIGNAAGTAYTLGAASFNAGFNTASVNATNGVTSVNFANVNNSPSGTPTNFSLRTQTFMVEQFVSTSGALGTAGGGVISFTGSPFLGANGLLANSAGGGTVGFATVRDTNGVNFATYTAPSGGTGGIVAAAPTLTTADFSGTAPTASDRVQFNPAAGAIVTPAALITAGSLRITPAGAGATLATGALGLATNALMLDGANNYTISGTGALGGTGTRYVYVNNASTSLTTSIQIANGSNPTDIAGPGFVVLNGTTSQNALTTTNRLTLLGGVLRGNNAQLGFGATGGAGFLNFRGGVLEINGGANGTGAAADFTRPLATTATAGAMNWTTSATDEGSGGFSAFGSNASVNLGGTTAGVIWGAGGFVADGYALRFGSTQSNAVLTFQNPIGLDAGTAGTYAAREFNVTKGTGGDGTVLSGVVSGSASTDLIKSGTGSLTLAATNLYAGRTFVEGGTLLIGATGSINNSSRVQVTVGALTLNNATALSDTGTLSLTSGTTLNLNAANGTTETVGALILDGTNEAAGTYTASQLAGFDPNITFTSGFGETLTITAIPEPATFFGGLLLIGTLGWNGRRRLRGLFALRRTAA